MLPLRKTMVLEPSLGHVLQSYNTVDKILMKISHYYVLVNQILKQNVDF